MADSRRRDQQTVTAVVKRYFDYEECEASFTEKKEKGPGRRLPFYDSVRKNINSFDVGGIRKKASILRAIGFESWHGVVNGCVAAFKSRFEADLRRPCSNGECGWRIGGRRDNQSSSGFWNRFCSAAFPDPRSAKAVGRAEENYDKFQDSCSKASRKNHFSNHAANVSLNKDTIGSAGRTVQQHGSEVLADHNKNDTENKFGAGHDHHNMSDCVGADTKREMSGQGLGEVKPNCSAGRAVPQRNIEMLTDLNHVNGRASTKDFAELRSQEKDDTKQHCHNFNCADVDSRKDLPGAGLSEFVSNCSAGRAVPQRNSEVQADSKRINVPASVTSRTLQKDLKDADFSDLQPNHTAGKAAHRRYSEALADPNRINGPASAGNSIEVRNGIDFQKKGGGSGHYKNFTEHAGVNNRVNIHKADLNELLFNRSSGRTASRRYSEAHANANGPRYKPTSPPIDDGVKKCSGIQNGYYSASDLHNTPCTASGSCNEKLNLNRVSTLLSNTARSNEHATSARRHLIHPLDSPRNNNGCSLEKCEPCRNNPKSEDFSKCHQSASTTEENPYLERPAEFQNRFRPDGINKHPDSVAVENPTINGRLKVAEDEPGDCYGESRKSSDSSGTDWLRKRPTFPDPNRSNGPAHVADCDESNVARSSLTNDHGVDLTSLYHSKFDRTGDGNHSIRDSATAWHCSGSKDGISFTESSTLNGNAAASEVHDESEFLNELRNSDTAAGHSRIDKLENLTSKDALDLRGSHFGPGIDAAHLTGNDYETSGVADHPRAYVSDSDSEHSKIADLPQADATGIGSQCSGIDDLSHQNASTHAEGDGTGISDYLSKESLELKGSSSRISSTNNCSHADVSMDPTAEATVGASGIADNKIEDVSADPGGNGFRSADRPAWPRCDHRHCRQYTSSLQTILNKIPVLRRSQATVSKAEPKAIVPEAGDPNPDVVPDFHVRPRKAQKKGRLPDGKVAVGLGVVLLPPCPVHLAQIVRWKAESKKEEGNEAYKRKEYREALQLYSEAIELCPEYAAYYGNRSACHMMLGRYDVALTDARQSTRLDDAFVKGHLREAKCNIALGDLAAAKCSLQKVERLEPTNSSLKEELNNIKCVEYFMVEALKSYEKKEYRQAVYHLDRALVSACACTRFLLQKAECLVFLNRYQEAQDITSDLIRGDGTNADAIYIRGLCLYYQDSIEKAFTHFQQVLRYAPDHTKAREAYKRARVLKQKKEEGNAAFRSGNLQQAYDIYSEALLIDSNNVFTNAKLYFNRALVSHKLKKLNQAVEDCTQAIKLDETYVKAYIKRGRCYQELEMHDESVRDFEKVYKLDGTQENHSLLQEAKLELKKSKRKDYYKILGIGRTASDDEIKKAYRKRALVHHPDRHANAPDDIKKEQEKKFKELGEAYSILSDPKKKSRYDCGQDFESSGADYDPYNIFQTFYTEPTARHFEFSNGRFPGGGGGGYSGGFPGGFTFQFG